MKIVLNREYGGFGLPEGFNCLHLRNKEDCSDCRTCEHLIKFLEEYPETYDLEVFEIPDEATDYTIAEYDGFETLYYVIDGKIKEI